MLVAACALGACGEDEAGPASPTTPQAKGGSTATTLTVQLAEENDSGRSGTATLPEKDGHAVVALQVNEAGEYHAHVHDVTCAKYRAMDDFSAQLATVLEGLEDLEGGKSESELTGPLSTYARPGYSINVHKYAQPYPVVACGDLTARAR